MEKIVPQYYTIQEAIVILGVSDSTIRKYIKAGKIKARQYGGRKGRILIPKSEIDVRFEEFVGEERGAV